MLVRIRSNVGIWRVDGLDDNTCLVSDVMERISETRPHVVYEKAFSSDPGCTSPLDTTLELCKQGIVHGGMIHCRIDAATCVESGDGNSNMKKRIDKDGTIQMVAVSTAAENRGFRKGLMPLRDMKMSWTLNDFIALNSQYEFKIKRQEEAWCKGVSLDTNSVNDFQSYLRRFNFSKQRVGYLYGTFETSENKEESTATSDPTRVKVEAIYEPPQESVDDNEGGFVLLEDPNEDTVEQMASLLGLRKVGWIIGHPPREDGFVLTSTEITTAAELQLEAAGGLANEDTGDNSSTPFVTVKVTIGDDGKNVSVEAFQVSYQCMAMVAEEALEVGPNPGFCVVNDTFTAIQEGKPSKTVENNFFLTVVPIVQHNSSLFCCATFPRVNRHMDDRFPSKEELKQQLSKANTAGWTFIDLLSDFQLLFFLSQYLDIATDLPSICDAIVHKDDTNADKKELNEGYKLIIAGIAGLDNAY